MVRMAAPAKHGGKHGRSAKRPSRAAKWPRWAFAVALAGIAVGSGFVFLPGRSAAPVADRLGPQPVVSPAVASLLGQGQDGANAAMPAPIVTATAKSPDSRHKGKPAHAPHSASSDPASGSGGFLDAAGLGLYDGDSSPAGIETAANWLGSPGTIKYAQDFIDATDWSRIENPWQLSNWKGSPYTMIWGVPMLPCGSPSTQCSTNVSDYDLVASGGANGYFKTLAQHLVANGFGSSYIRLGWEFNADWMGWGICNTDDSGLASWAGDFVPAFRNIVTAMRSVSPNFKFIWNPIDSSNAACSGGKLENFYPGDNYVDMVSLDAYDGIGGETSDTARWTDITNGVNAGGWTAEAPNSVNGQSFSGYGLSWLTAFAKDRNKEEGLPEWGLNDANTSAGGGDDSYFMTQIAAWIKAYATGPAIFWNYGGGTLPLDIPGYTSGGTSAATAAFKSAFSMGV